MKVLVRLLFVHFVILVESLVGQSVLYTFHGGHPVGRLGRSVSDAGDVNGDGYADIIVGGLGMTESVRVFSGLSGSTLYAFDGDPAYYDFDRSVSGAGDVNGDGYPDLVVGVAGQRIFQNLLGNAKVYSGLDGAVLYSIDGDPPAPAAPDDFFGWSVSGAGDVDGDGYADFIVGAFRDDNNGGNSGSARVFSGVNGTALYTFNGDSPFDQFGYSVSDAGDVNGDGYADLIVGASNDDNTGNDSGSARVFSGVNGVILYSHDGDSAGDFFGRSVSSAGDVNGDGNADFIVGAPRDDNEGRFTGSASVFSGVNGTALHIFDGVSSDSSVVFAQGLGGSVSGAGDVNGDGYPDLIVGAPGSNINVLGSVSTHVFSGEDGGLLSSFSGDSPYEQFGFSVSGAGDVNGDGLADLIVGAPGLSLTGPGFTESKIGIGFARVISGATLSLTSDVHNLSLDDGGTQTLSLAAGSNNANRNYLMLGSLGSAPGFDFGRLHIPLNPDIWFLVTILHGIVPEFDSRPFANPFGNFNGRLDSEGMATATFTLHEESLRNPGLNDPALVGTSFWYAYVVRRGFFGIKMVSNAVPVTIVP